MTVIYGEDQQNYVNGYLAIAVSTSQYIDEWVSHPNFEHPNFGNFRGARALLPRSICQALGEPGKVSYCISHIWHK